MLVELKSCLSSFSNLTMRHNVKILRSNDEKFVSFRLLANIIFGMACRIHWKNFGSAFWLLSAEIEMYVGFA